MKFLRSLRSRLVASYVALALLLLSVTGYVFSNVLYAYAISMQRTQIAIYMKQATFLLENAQTRNFSRNETLTFLRQNLPDVSVELEAIPADRLKYLKLKREEPPLPPGKGVLIFSSLPVKNSFSLPAGRKLPFSFYQFTLHPSAFTVLSSLFRQVLLVLVLSLVLAIFIGWLLSRWLARPLSHLTEAIEAVAEGNFQKTVKQPGIIELDRLAKQFNRMVLQLRESFRSLSAERDTAQRFAADAAHELKTPVTTLRAYHELITETPGRLEQVLPAQGRQIDRMEKIISGLLQLANLGEGTGLILQPADLREAIRQLEPVYQALAEDSGLRLTTSYPDNTVPVLLDLRLLELALNNLMDNAAKYTPPGGQITLTLQVDASSAVITVKDTGTGIAQEEMPFIFERFQRGVDTQSIPGTGLGLAIAREAVLRLGGTIEASSKTGCGTQFIIQLPLLHNQ